MIALSSLGVVACVPTVTVETPDPEVEFRRDSIAGSDIWTLSLSEVEGKAENSRAKLLFGATVAVSDTSGEPRAQINLAAVDALSNFGSGAALEYGDQVTLWSADGEVLAEATGALGDFRTSDDGSAMIYTLPVPIPLDEVAAVAAADSVAGRVGYDFAPTFTFTLSPRHVEGVRELLAQSGAFKQLDAIRAAADRAARVPLSVVDSVADEWNEVSTWSIEAPEVPLGLSGVLVSAATHIRFEGGTDPTARCALRLVLRKEGGWSGADFAEHPAGRFYQNVEVQLDGRRAPDLDFVVYPQSVPDGGTTAPPVPFAVHTNPRTAWLLAEMADARVARMRLGAGPPFEVSAEAMDVIRALRARVSAYRHTARWTAEPPRPYCLPGGG